MRRNPRLDFVKREVDIPDFGTFSLANIPQSVMPNLALIGLKHTLLTALNMDVAYQGLISGQLPKVRDLGKTKADPWSEAMAMACAEQQAVVDLGPKAKASQLASQAATHLDAMREHVAGLSKEARRALRAHPAVIQHHRKITGVTPDQLSLLAIAGVLPRQSEFPMSEAPTSERAPEPEIAEAAE